MALVRMKGGPVDRVTGYKDTMKDFMSMFAIGDGECKVVARGR